MFIATLFTMAKKCKQAKCPSKDDWIINNTPHNGVLFSPKRTEVLVCARTWMTLGNIMLNEKNHTTSHMLFESIYTKYPE